MLQRRLAISTLLIGLFCLSGWLRAQATITVTNLNDTGSGSLREAIASASPSVQDTILFQPGLSGTITLGAPLNFNKPIRIDGAATAPGITIAGSADIRFFEVYGLSPPATVPCHVEMRNLRLLGSASKEQKGVMIVGVEYVFTAAGLVFDSLDSRDNGAGLEVRGAASTITGCHFINCRGDEGGALAIRGTGAVISNCTFENNVARYYGGGVGLAYADNVTVAGCSFIGNLVSGASFGGGAVGALSSSQVDVSGCTFDGNHASTGGAVGLTFTAGVLSGCAFTGNSATNEGGAVSGTTVLTITVCTFNSNSAGSGAGTGRAGGAVHARGTTAIDDCLFLNNSSGKSGGAIEIQYGSLLLSGTTFSGNTAVLLGGAASIMQGNVTACTFHGNTAGDSGAAVSVSGQNSTFARCTFSGNTAHGRGGGGVAAFGPASFTNCTFSGNVATTGGGAGLWCHSSSAASWVLTLVSCTFADNLAPQAAAGTTVLLESSQGGHMLTCHFSNSIFAGTGTSNLAAIGPGGTSLASGDNNICTDSTGNLFGANDKPATNPLLAPLADNGGPTRTHSLLAGSPALDQGRPIAGLSTDQRGVARPVDNPALANAANGDGTDIGAFEHAVDPDIDVLSALGGGSLGSGASGPVADNLAYLQAGTATPFTWRVCNVGAPALSVFSISASPSGAAPNCTVSAPTALNPASPIPVGGIAAFSLNVTPTAAGNFQFTITIVSADPDEGSYVIVASGNSTTLVAPSFTSAPPLPNAFVGMLYSHVFVASGSPAPTFSATGLPAWLSLNPVTGVLAGTPAAGDYGTTSTITLIANNGVSPSATQAFSVTVAMPAGGGSSSRGGSNDGGCSMARAGNCLPWLMVAMLALLTVRGCGSVARRITKGA